MLSADQVAPLPDGAGLLHIGPPKTGTTALQAALHAARADLLAHGVAYVSRTSNPFDTARWVAGWDGAGEAATYRRRWERIARDFRSSDARHAVLSSEGFANAGPDRVPDVHEALGPDTFVLVTLRPTTALLPSAWQQDTRQGNPLGLEDWVRAAFDPDAEPRYLRPLDPAHLLRTWGPVFGEDRMIFLAPDPHERTSVLRAVEALLGLPEMLTLQPERNASLGYAEVEMLRHLYAAVAEHDDAARWWKAMRRTSRNLDRTPLPAAGRQRIVLPRWAADAARRHDEQAYAAIEASGARIVGDLRRLVETGGEEPETVEEPGQIDVATAGVIAEVVARTAVEVLGPEAGGGRRTGLDEHSARELLRALAGRVRRRRG